MLRCNRKPYLSFAKQARAAPKDATTATHKLVRDRCKAVVLGMNYGIGPETMAPGRHHARRSP
jgi:DNA polymerase-1